MSKLKDLLQPNPIDKLPIRHTQTFKILKEREEYATSNQYNYESISDGTVWTVQLLQSQHHTTLSDSQQSPLNSEWQ